MLNSVRSKVNKHRHSYLADDDDDEEEGGEVELEVLRLFTSFPLSHLLPCRSPSPPPNSTGPTQTGLTAAATVDRASQKRDVEKNATVKIQVVRDKI